MHADMENRTYQCPKCRRVWGRYYEQRKYEIEYHEGLPAFGLSKRICPSCGGEISRTTHALPDHIKDMIYEMYQDGIPSSDIRQICGISDYTLYQYNKRKVNNENTVD